MKISMNDRKSMVFIATSDTDLSVIEDCGGLFADFMGEETEKEITQEELDNIRKEMRKYFDYDSEIDRLFNLISTIAANHKDRKVHPDTGSLVEEQIIIISEKIIELKKEKENNE